MNVYSRQKDIAWTIATDSNGRIDMAAAHLAVLMDLRDELKEMNRTLAVLRCRNFIAIPGVLRQIRANTSKPQRKRVTR